MAESYTKVLLSGLGVTGVPLTIVPTSTLGAEIHEAHATALDEIWLWATNESVTAATLTLEWGAATEPQVTSIPPQSEPIMLAMGWPLTGSAVLTGFASTASVITVHGYVNRITQS